MIIFGSHNTLLLNLICIFFFEEEVIMKTITLQPMNYIFAAKNQELYGVRQVLCYGW